MTAEQMFIKMKYKKHVFPNGVIQYERVKLYEGRLVSTSRIRFYPRGMSYRNYYVDLYHDGSEKRIHSRMTSLQLHEAIVQQMKELKDTEMNKNLILLKGGK